MREKGIGAVLAIGIAVVIVVIAVAMLLVFSGAGSRPIQKPGTGLIYDDFDDGQLGSDVPGTSAGMMGGYPPDPDRFEFVQVDSGYALKMSVEVPSDKWSGYWSFFKPGDVATDPILVGLGNGYDLSGYTELRMAVRADREFQIKIELQDTAQFSSASNAQRVFSNSSSTACLEKYGKSPGTLAQEIFGTTPDGIGGLSDANVHTATSSHNGVVRKTVGTSWTELVVPLTEFTQMASGLNLKDIRQINIVFEGPVTTALYVDWIAFT